METSESNQQQAPLTGTLESNEVSEFKLERYKYLNQQLNSLNDNMHKYLTLYQALTVAVAGGAITIFVSWKGLRIDAAIARAGIQGLVMLLIIIAAFIIISILAGLFSWFDYRREETKLLNQVVAPTFRNQPNLKNFWRWYETYLLLFVLLATSFIYYFIEARILPLIQ